MGRKIIGLDLGIASVGWSLVELQEDPNNPQGKIIDTGVRAFQKAEVGKTGESPNKERREARSTRRRLRRLRLRLFRIRNLFVEYGLLDKSYLGDNESNLNHNQGFQKLHQQIAKRKIKKEHVTPYLLRTEALKRKLEVEEWVVVLTHLAKRRGYQSNSKRQEVLESSSDDSKDKVNERKKALAGISENQSILQNYQTVGEMLYKDKKFREHKRNKADIYSHTIARDDLRKEIQILFEKQREFENGYASNEFEERYIDIWSFQRSYDYLGLIEGTIGRCTFEPEEKRAAKDSYSAEEFRLWQSINNLTVFNRDGKKIDITNEQRKDIAKCARKQKDITYKTLRGILGLSKEINLDQFKALHHLYPSPSQDKPKDPEKKPFITLKGWHELKKAYQNYRNKNPNAPEWKDFAKNTERLDTIADILASYKDDNRIYEEFRKTGLQLHKQLIDEFLTANISKFVHLSIKVLCELIPHLKEGKRYDEAVLLAGYGSHSERKVSSHKVTKLPPIPVKEVRNPLVLRPLTQARKIINAIIEKYGQVHEIHIELLRDIAKPLKERAQIQRGQESFREQKERAIQRFNENYNRQPIKDEISKYRLAEEQNWICPYSGNQINPKRITEKGYVDIDHILPISRSIDDSRNNKVVCMTSENRQKGNLIPYEYFMKTGKGMEKWGQFLTRTSSYKQAKRRRLQRTSFTDEEARDFKERNIEKTVSAWITKFFKDFLETHLEFLAIDTTKKNIKRNTVQSRNGMLTAFLRARWGLIKRRDESDRHHALDATVIACATQAMVQRVSNYNKYRELMHFDRKGQEVYKDTPAFQKEIFIKSIFLNRGPLSEKS